MSEITIMAKTVLEVIKKLEEISLTGNGIEKAREIIEAKTKFHSSYPDIRIVDQWEDGKLKVIGFFNKQKIMDDILNL